MLVVVAVVIAGNVPNCLWLDPAVGILGSFVIISWAYTLLYDTSQTLLDMSPDIDMTHKLRARLEKIRGTTLLDLHVWRLGPGHLGAIVSVVTEVPRDTEYYRRKISAFKAISHLTVEIQQRMKKAL
jgi:Co/Zn/Cd efflux system component